MTKWEYLARNLKKVAGMAMENDFNKHGQEGPGVRRGCSGLRDL